MALSGAANQSPVCDGLLRSLFSASKIRSQLAACPPLRLYFLLPNSVSMVLSAPAAVQLGAQKILQVADVVLKEVEESVDGQHD